MKFNIVINKPIHTIEAVDMADAERQLEDQWNTFRYELCNPTFDLDDLTLQPAGVGSDRLPTLTKLPLPKLTRRES